MKIDLRIRCSLSFGVELKDDPSKVVDTRDYQDAPGEVWGDCGEPFEYVQLVPHPFEQLEEGQVLLVARGVSIELDIAELRAALNALNAVKGIL